MLSLIYNLSSISSYKQPQEHKWLQVNITQCNYADGKFIDTAVFDNKIDYKLKLSYEEGRPIVVSVRFRVGIDSAKILIEEYTVQLVKYTENIINHELNNEVVILFDPKTDFYQIEKYTVSISDEGSSYTQITIKIEKNFYYVVPVSGVDNIGLARSFWDQFDQSTYLTVFRKSLGIEDDKIKTTKFKFKIVLTLKERLTGKIILLYLDTNIFGFHQKEEGTLGLVE
ncbi:hypothetical protein CDIK_4387 [Cucumispora dikerogammari]|nr:hypothetical protein CDIK_4387 [Cucumispora dikerogammari]